MKELSQEQIERALSAVEKISTWPMDLDQAREQLIAAAPYLQFPWEPPTLDEIEHARVVHALNDPFWRSRSIAKLCTFAMGAGIGYLAVWLWKLCR